MATAHRASIFHLLDDPRVSPDAYQFIDDGLLVVTDGKVTAMGEAAAELSKLPPGTEVVTHENAVIMPGFFDLHMHFPQLTTVAVYGEQLLGWLNAIIPEEEVYKVPEIAAERGRLFLKECLRAGTTSMVVYGSWAKESVDALFTEAERLNMCLVAGKVMANCVVPAGCSADKGV